MSGGSFGQIRGDLQYGRQQGNEAVCVAGTGLRESGGRDLQSSDIYNFYGTAGWQGDKGSVRLGIIASSTQLNGPGTSPVELLAADSAAQFTGPNNIANKYLQANLSTTYDINDVTSLQGLIYYT